MILIIGLLVLGLAIGDGTSTNPPKESQNTGREGAGGKSK